MAKASGSARKGARAAGPPRAVASVKRRAKGSAPPAKAKAPTGNGAARSAPVAMKSAAKAPGKPGRLLDRRASEKTVQGGRTTVGESAVVSRGKYVYCIIESGDPLKFGPIGIGADPSDVYTVHYKNLAAVVSDAPLEVLDSTREHVLAHERVNETVMREHTVIPMSFGTIFKTREDIVELLRSAAEAFGDVLNLSLIHI